MRLYYVGYGHNPSGKLYTYWGNNNLRTGQTGVAPVTNKRTGRTYNTMIRIMRTASADGALADNEAQRLSQGGIGVKSIAGADVSALPGWDKGGFKNKKEWAADSDARYHDRLKARLLDMEI